MQGKEARGAKGKGIQRGYIQMSVHNSVRVQDDLDTHLWFLLVKFCVEE